MASPKETLENYFDDLLFGDDPEYIAQQVAYADAEQQKRKLEKLLQSSTPSFAPVTTEKNVEIPVAEAVVTQPATLPVAEPEPVVVEPAPVVVPPNAAEIRGEVTVETTVAEDQEQQFSHLAVEWLENGRPAWAQNDFDVLLFKVSGLTLAVPLVALGQIQNLTDELTPLFGQADWFMGLLPTPNGKVRTINTAKFVMPERYNPEFLKTAQYVISISGVPWGLAVDSVTQPMTLHPEDVKWRTERSKRPWLAGTVKEHMCALLDIPMMGQVLNDADVNTKKH